MRTSQVFLTMICLAGLVELPLFFTEEPQKMVPQFYDWQDRISIPIVGITSFVFCPDNHVVWTVNYVKCFDNHVKEMNQILFNLQ